MIVTLQYKMNKHYIKLDKNIGNALNRVIIAFHIVQLLQKGFFCVMKNHR